MCVNPRVAIVWRGRTETFLDQIWSIVFHSTKGAYSRNTHCSFCLQHDSKIGYNATCLGWSGVLLLDGPNPVCYSSCSPDDVISTLPFSKSKLRISPHPLMTSSQLAGVNGALSASRETPKAVGKPRDQQMACRDEGGLRAAASSTASAATTRHSSAGGGVITHAASNGRLATMKSSSFLFPFHLLYSPFSPLSLLLSY